MVIISEEEISTSNSKQKQEFVYNETTSSLLLEHNHNCSVILQKDFPGAVLKPYQAPERTMNLEFPQSSSHPSKNISVKMLGWNNNTETVDRSQIIKTLREMVKRVVMDFRLSLSLSSPLNVNEEDDDVVEAVPVSFRPPQPTNLDMKMSPKMRVTTLLVGETLISFQLPYNCPFGQEDIEMLVEEGRRETMTLNINEEIIYNVPRYTFLQRLKGWKLERRQRVNGRFDMYYHHLQSRRVFRSITEVVNFFIYEVYPDKPVQKPAAKSKIGEDDPSIHGKKTERKEKRDTPLKRKFEELKKSRDKWQPIFNLNDDDDHQNPIYELDDDNEGQISKEETVDKFLAEAYDNLLNLHDHAHKPKSFNFDINEEIFEEDHNVEEFMAEAYNNLMNSQINYEPNPQKGQCEYLQQKEKEKGKEKITNVDTKESMEVQNVANSIPNEKLKRFNIKEVNGNVIFTDIDCEPTTSGGGGGSSSAMEVAKSVAFLHMDECDLINHIQESSDMFDLAMFLANNKGDNGGF